MKTVVPHIDADLVLHLKNKYFCDGSKVVSLRRGEFLMRQNQQNKRLYLVLKGQVAGFLDSGSGNRQEIFRSAENMFVGVHSFFSKSFSAYADVVALQESKMAYIGIEEFNDCGGEFLIEDFVPVIVHELSARQVFTKNLMLQKEAALRKLYQSDKLATLGQMAAGLAHELNNAIGIMNGNSEWIAQEVYQYFKSTEIPTIFSNFDRGFENGQTLSSNEVRTRKKSLEKKHKLSPASAKKLAKIDFDDRQVTQFDDPVELEELIDRMYHFWEMGVAIHDILVASKHAVHVLKSIKQLSVADQARHELDVNDTIKEALTLLKNVVREVQIELKTGDLTPLMANQGELVQIWVNIIKNACESMINAGNENPKLLIESGKKRSTLWVSVTDNGPGIPEDLRKKIFQPNFTTKKGGLSFGLGLGLSIVQRLVDSYNGRVEVTSKPGKTTFTIKIPTS